MTVAAMRKRCHSKYDIKVLMQAYAPSDHKLRDEVIKPPKPRAKRKHEEDELQIACCKLLDSLRGTEYFAIPNHLYLGKSQSKEQHFSKLNYIRKQKRMGMKKGPSDLIIGFINIHGKGSVCAPELKVGDNKSSDEQKDFSIKWNKFGWFTGEVRSLQDLTNMLKLAGHPSFKI